MKRRCELCGRSFFTAKWEEPGVCTDCEEDLKSELNYPYLED